MKYYIGMISVILIWGISPNISKYLLNYYSPALQSCMSGLISIIAMLIICRNKLKQLNINYFRVAIPTGLFYSVAVLLQKTGLLLTTPAKYAFLENTSCIFVPILMLILIKKKITSAKVISGLLCLYGTFVLCNASLSEFGNIGVGELMCALAGVLYSVNIAGTAVYAKNLDASLYLLIQFVIHGIVSFGYSVFTMSQMEMSFELIPFLVLVALVLVSTVLGWTIRTNCLKHLDASFVAVAMPFAAVITAIISVLIRTDTLTTNTIIGSTVIFVAIVLSGLDDARRVKR